MADGELAAFRERWKQELSNKTKTHAGSSKFSGEQNQKDCRNRYFEETAEKSEVKRSRVDQTTEELSEDAEAEEQPGYVSIASSLLDGRTSPLLDRIQEERTKRRREFDNSCVTHSPLRHQQLQKRIKREELVDQLIQDLVRYWSSGNYVSQNCL